MINGRLGLVLFCRRQTQQIMTAAKIGVIRGQLFRQTARSIAAPLFMGGQCLGKTIRQ